MSGTLKNLFFQAQDGLNLHALVFRTARPVKTTTRPPWSACPACPAPPAISRFWRVFWAPGHGAELSPSIIADAADRTGIRIGPITISRAKAQISRRFWARSAWLRRSSSASRAAASTPSCWPTSGPNWSRPSCLAMSGRGSNPRAWPGFTAICRAPAVAAPDLDAAVAHYRSTMGASFPGATDDDWRLYAQNSRLAERDAGADAPLLRSATGAHARQLRSFCAAARVLAAIRRRHRPGPRFARRIFRPADPGSACRNGGAAAVVPAPCRPRRGTRLFCTMRRRSKNSSRSSTRSKRARASSRKADRLGTENLGPNNGIAAARLNSIISERGLGCARSGKFRCAERRGEMRRHIAIGQSDAETDRKIAHRRRNMGGEFGAVLVDLKIVQGRLANRRNQAARAVGVDPPGQGSECQRAFAG